ncbi:TM2 domain-containing protein [Borreliella burgdorferi]|uniref:TM2 domain-containing protein n=1 Tax=Borreliella burgdorferi TaxID=139 RepID=UPI000D0381D9|nr:TM2 domain-containing protein [Borreliella burgdorferi]PRQ97301.1 hypothetical protein CV674_05555 [Borreliella burgdorferi]PRR37943.1 hypothetical protein CV676_05745 [Borreliella burgdorferi]
MTKYFNDDVRCSSCNRLIRTYDETCVACGAKNKQNKKSYYGLIAFLFYLFFGYLGFSNLYLGKNPKIGFTFLFISIVFLLIALLLFKADKSTTKY